MYNQYAIRVFVLVGLLIAAIFSISIILGLAERMVVPSAIAAAILAAFAGLFSLWRNRTAGLFREDPLHMMQLMFYFGLLIFSFGEITIAASLLISDDVLLSYLPSITRLFGMLFWLLGILNYVRATHKVLSFIDIKIWIFLISICSISVVTVGVGVSQLNTSMITAVSLIIFTLGTGIMTCFMFFLVWIFRKGKFRDVLLSVFSCLLLILIRSLVIAYSTEASFVLGSIALALEAYLCLWISESLFFQLQDT